MNFIKYCRELLSLHPQAALGVLIGFVIGCFILIVGFFKTLFLFLCAAIGFNCGIAKENGISFKNMIKRLLNKQEM